MTFPQYDLLRARVRDLLGAFAKAEAAALADPEIMDQFGLTPHEKELAHLDPGDAVLVAHVAAGRLHHVRRGDVLHRV